MANPFSEEQKKFSIISPCYGVTYKSLEKCAEALSTQEYKNFEWIVVFDGKHSKGEKAMSGLIKKYPDLNIQYHTIIHGGAPKARNYGQTKATGDYYSFLDPDMYLYPETLRMWANAFEDSTINRVLGLYEMLNPDGSTSPIGGSVPFMPNNKVWYGAFKSSNFCNGAFPVRASAYISWDETCKSLQDWDWAIRMLKRDDFQGKDWLYIPHAFFATEPIHEKGISHDSHTNWIERSDYVRNKNGIPKSDICVVSHGAVAHGIHVAEKLGADYLPMPSFKPHKYKKVYLIGFYTKENPQYPIVTQSHMQVFDDFKGKKIIHWIGTDILHMHWNCSFQKIKTLKKWFKDNKIIHLSEFDPAKKELEELGIESKVVPLPPQKLYSPMPLPEKFTVGVYNPNRPDIYNHDLIMEIVRSMPDVKFYFFGNEDTKGQKGENFEHLGWINLDEWMDKFSCNLRITAHDGLPLLPLQFMTAGRNVVTNVDLKGVIKVEKDRKSIVKGLRIAQDRFLDKKWPKYWTKELSFEKFVKTIRGL